MSQQIQLQYLYDVLLEAELVHGESPLLRLITILESFAYIASGKKVSEMKLAHGVALVKAEYGSISTENVTLLWERLPLMVRQATIPASIFEV